MSEAFRYIEFRVEDNVGVITFNRPAKRNAVSWEMAEEVAGLLRALHYRDEVRAIVLTGAGRGFCAGGDLEWISGESERPMPGTSDASRPVPRSQRKTPGGPFFEVTRQLVAVDKPVIAAIHGACVGAGLAYAAACDRRFADTTTKMCAAFTNVGVAPDCGVSYFLPRIAGFSNALMMVTTGRMFSAEECRQLGVIDELVPEGQHFAAAMDYARALAARASVAVDMARRLIHLSQHATLDEILDYEGLAGVCVAASADAKEGTMAFVEKRKPVFRGV
ncbi:MAG: enoyl-CoA hydratase/isomerase family protein [Steroidobacteraceae bacterium]